MPHKNYVKLTTTHPPGSTELTVHEAVDWQPGEQLVLSNPWEEVELLEVRGGSCAAEARALYTPLVTQINT